MLRRHSKKAVEVDKLIDKLRDANATELQKLVVENVLAFNEAFWIRLAARTDTYKSDKLDRQMIRKQAKRGFSKAPSAKKSLRLAKRSGVVRKKRGP